MVIGEMLIGDFWRMNEIREDYYDSWQRRVKHVCSYRLLNLNMMQITS